MKVSYTFISSVHYLTIIKSLTLNYTSGCIQQFGHRSESGYQKNIRSGIFETWSNERADYQRRWIRSSPSPRYSDGSSLRACRWEHQSCWCAKLYPVLQQYLDGTRACWECEIFGQKQDEQPHGRLALSPQKCDPKQSESLVVYPKDQSRTDSKRSRSESNEKWRDHCTSDEKVEEEGTKISTL